MRTQVLILVTYLSVSLQQEDMEHLIDMHVGCFMDSPQARDLEKRLSGSLNTVEMCTKACRQLYFKYAGYIHSNHTKSGDIEIMEKPGVYILASQKNSSPPL